MRLQDKVAIVMGAGSVGPGWGNGKATSVLFARQGAKVVCVDINESAAQETAQLIAGEGGEALALCADVTTSSDIHTVVKTCLHEFGRIDILNNNVGIVSTGGVVETAEPEWHRVFDINLKSCFLAMKHVIPVMQKQGGGSIINISSVASIRDTGVPYVTYSATKAAMNHMTRTTAAQYAKERIRVNAVLPGLMKTPMVEQTVGMAAEYGDGDIEAMWQTRDKQVPMGHMGDAWDVAHAVLFLASDESRYITGIELRVDGGITLGFGSS